MRKTGSREPLKAWKPRSYRRCSIAVNTFSMRFGSRRNQRPLHQKISLDHHGEPDIDTIKIGHNDWTPLWNLSINQLLRVSPRWVWLRSQRRAFGCRGLNAAVVAGAAAREIGPGGTLPIEAGAPGLIAAGAGTVTAAGPAAAERLRRRRLCAAEIAQAK